MNVSSPHPRSEYIYYEYEYAYMFTPQVQNRTQQKR